MTRPLACGYLTWAQRGWEWFSSSGLIGPGGLAALFEITGDRGYLTQGESIASATLAKLTTRAGRLPRASWPNPVADGLEQRDYARTERDARDSRVLNVVLTTAGTAYAQAMTEVIHTLNREFCERVDSAQLVAADTVLRAVLAGDSELRDVASAIHPPR